MSHRGIAGNRGKGVRSDCYVSLEINGSQGLDIRIKSRVNALFGDKIKSLVHEVLEFFGITDALVEIEDTGALPFVMAARLEAAIKSVRDIDTEFLPDIDPQNMQATTRDRLRFSRLYLPGNTPRLMLNAGIHKPNGLILDLEDAVAFDKKHEARFLVRNALRKLDFCGAERMVRINQIPKGLDDLDYVIPHYVNLVLIPKCESADQISQVNERIREIRSKHNIEHPVWLMPIIESALGVIKAYEIASADNSICSMVIGLEDYTADLGTRRTNEGTESFYARCHLVNVCKAAGIQAIDSVFSDVADMEALKKSVLLSKSLGFDGMGCIHPRQIRVIHENFAPDDAEIAKAKRIYKAFLVAKEKGLGVISLGTKMIDAPVVKRAENTINLAITMGKLSPDWGDEDEEDTAGN